MLLLPSQHSLYHLFKSQDSKVFDNFQTQLLTLFYPRIDFRTSLFVPFNKKVNFSPTFHFINLFIFLKNLLNKLCRIFSHTTVMINFDG